jgi:hypothetical protein
MMIMTYLFSYGYKNSQPCDVFSVVFSDIPHTPKHHADITVPNKI